MGLCTHIVKASYECNCNGKTDCCVIPITLTNCDSNCWGLDLYIQSNDGNNNYLKIDGDNGISKGNNQPQKIFIPPSGNNQYTIQFAYKSLWYDAFTPQGSLYFTINPDDNLSVWFGNVGHATGYIASTSGCGGACQPSYTQEKKAHAALKRKP